MNCPAFRMECSRCVSTGERFFFMEDCTCPERIFFLVERVPVKATTLADSREVCQILNAAVQSRELRSEYCISPLTGPVLDEPEIPKIAAAPSKPEALKIVHAKL